MPTLETCALIAEDVYHDRPTSIQWHEPIRVPEQDIYCADNEFAGGAYAGTDGAGVIAFRGSREMEDWKGANLEIIRRQVPERQLGKALASLGGGLAAVVAAAVTWVPVRGVTFNAPGLAEFVGTSAECSFDLGRPNADNVLNFRSEADIVSRWGCHIGKVYDVPGAGRHGIDSFIRCLRDSRMGGWNM
jgi:hypothetical protein